jgi:acetoin utilization deacetylase AcuC-like enzyme
MAIVCSLVPSLEHSDPDHPENPERFRLLGDLQDSPLAAKIRWVEAAEAPLDSIRAVHQDQMLADLQAACRRAPAIIDGAPTYVSRESFHAARMAAGGTLACSQAILHGEARRGFALIRPPGHHAEPDQPMGFCLFNNLAIAVRDALASGVASALVVDFDAHHGNGTEHVFWADPHVAYLSTHQWGIYPGSGFEDEAPHARGRIVNVPLPAYAGDEAFRLALEELIRPLVRAFRPDMLFVSAGFDGHWMDPLTSLGVTTRGFHELSRGLVDLAEEMCQGRVLFVLEGGYDPLALAAGCLAALGALADEGCPADPYGSARAPAPDVRAQIERIRRLHRL